MRRREFLIVTAGVAGALPQLAAGQVRPCQPTAFSLDGLPVTGGVCLAGPSGPAPQWFRDMPDKTWATPVINTVDHVKPSPLPAGYDGHAAVCNNWSGGTVDQDRAEFVLAANGGHQGYSGNEVYVCPLRDERPAWMRITDPSPPSAVQAGTYGRNSPARYADGRPSSTHTYNRPCWGNGRLWLAGIDSEYTPVGWWTSACYSFDRESRQWAYHGIGIETPHESDSYCKWLGGSAAYDPVTNTVWSVGQYGIGSTGDGVYTVDAGTGRITNRRMMQNMGYSWSVVAADLRLLIVGGVDSIFTLDLQNPAAGFVRRNHSGTHASGAYCGGVYHPASRAIFSWHNNGANIRKLSIPASIGSTWTNSVVQPSSLNRVVPGSAQANGTYGRFNIIQDMGNGQSAFVLLNSTTGSTYVYKIPAEGI
jgi:hypothetical protein